MDIFLQKLQAVTDPAAFAAVFAQVVIIPCDGNLGMGREVEQTNVALFGQAVYRHQLLLLLAQRVSLHLFLTELIDDECRQQDQDGITERYF